MSTRSGPDAAEPPRQDDAVPPDVYAARITGSRETLAKLMKAFALDAGCRPHPEVNADGSGALLVYATDERIRELQAAGYQVERGDNVSAARPGASGRSGQGRSIRRRTHRAAGPGRKSRSRQAVR